MLLEQRQKELAAIGASIGANCRPCIEHHIAAAREAGLSEAELTAALATAEAVRHEAVEQLSARVDELLCREGAARQPAADGATDPDSSTDRVLVAVGASVGANAHRQLRKHTAAALETGLTWAQVEAALKMAEYVQHRAGEITAQKAAHALQELGAAPPTGLRSAT